MKNSLTQINLSGFFRRSQGAKELEAILNILPDATFLIDKETNKIVAGNGRALELTGYSSKTLSGLGLNLIFPKLNQPFLANLNPYHPQTIITPLSKHSGIQINVKLESSLLGENTKWARFSFRKISAQYKKNIEEDLGDQRWHGFQILSKAILSKDLDSSLIQLLQAGQLLTRASFIALFLPSLDKDILILSHSWGKTEFLPKELSISEVNHLRIPVIWSPGDQAISELHRKAITGKLSYIATIPLKENSPQEGIMVLGDQFTQPPQELIPLLKILTEAISTSKTYHNSFNSLQIEISNLSGLSNISQTIKNYLNDGLIFISEDQVIIDINEPAAITLGYSVDEVKNKQLEEILVGEKSVKHLINSLQLETQELQDLGELKLHRRDGHPLLLNIKAIPILSKTHTKVIGLLLSDLSQHEEFRLRNKQLEQQALLGEVMSIFAHEVRNPINNISTGLQVMSSSFDTDDPIQNDLIRLKKDTDRLANLMKSVLSFSKTKEYKFNSVDIEGLVRNLIDRWRLNLASKDIHPHIKCANNITKVKGDRRALEQVLTNIIQNAVNAMNGQGGTLGIRIEPVRDTGLLNMLKLDISDTGPGIPEEIRERIFEPFFTTSKNGTGLGLAITKRIIAAHNGQITVNSFPGGTLFSIILPMVTQ